jgi:hypothetical protein
MSSYVCNKTSFPKAIIKDPDKKSLESLERLSNFIKSSHTLARHATIVFKLYVLSLDDDFELDSDDHQKIYSFILYLLNNDYRPRNEDDVSLINTLRPIVNLYLNESGFIQPKISSFQQLNTYLSRSMATNLLTNVSEHFCQMLYKYINLRLDVKNSKSKLTKDEQQLFLSRIKAVKSYVCRLTDDHPSLTTEEEILYKELGWVLPFDEVQSEPLPYMVLVDTASYVAAYCRLSSLFEYHGFKRFASIPLRRTLADGHLPIDTKILLQNILLKHDLIKNMAEHKHEIWSTLFRLNSKAFTPRTGYSFDGRITTDGTSVSIYFKKDGYNKRSGTKRKTKQQLKEEVQRKYFQYHLKEIKQCRNYVVIDPNKDDLLYIKDKNGIKMRYTRIQRRKETGAKKYNAILRDLKLNCGIAKIESDIPSHRAMNKEGFLNYIRYCREHEPELKPFYQETVHNKFKWNRHINTQRSEQRLVNRMKTLYGEDTAIIMGDWSDAGHTMKFQTSSKTKGFEKLYRRNGFKFYLLDEHKTSSQSPIEEDSPPEHILARPNPRPWRRRGKLFGKENRRKWKTVYGLLCCKNMNEGKQTGLPVFTYWNRDDLSTENMRIIVRTMLKGGARPKRYCRS